MLVKSLTVPTLIDSQDALNFLLLHAFFWKGRGIVKNVFFFGVVVDAQRERERDRGTGKDKRRPLHELVHYVNKRGASGINI